MAERPAAYGSLRLSGSDVRRLRELRDQVKVASVSLPMPLQRRLLELLDQARAWTIPTRPLPEMTRGELVRAIRWRLGTIPLAGVIAAAAFVARHRLRRRSAPEDAERRAAPVHPFRRRKS